MGGWGGRRQAPPWERFVGEAIAKLPPSTGTGIAGPPGPTGPMGSTGPQGPPGEPSYVPGPQGSSCFLASGTGLAAGNHLLEALSHALRG